MSTTRRWRPEVEPLEDRTVLSTLSTLAGLVPVRGALVATQAHHHLALRGSVSGAWTPQPTLPDTGTTQALAGAGAVAPLGVVTANGTLHTPGFIRQGFTTGTVTLTNARGSVTLQLTGTEPQPGFSPPAKNYRFTISGGTGAYAGATGQGTATLQETTATTGGGTFVLTFRPGR